MDSVFVVVKEAPAVLSKYEMVLERPSFMDEIVTCERKRGGAHIIGANYLRAIAEEIGRKYDKNFNPYRNVVPTDYAGIPCPTLKDVSALVHKMFDARYPKIYDSYYETKIRARPFDVRVIYLLDNEEFGATLKRCGVKQIQESQINDCLGFQKEVLKETKVEPTLDLSFKLEAVSDTSVQEPIIDTSALLETLAETAPTMEVSKTKGKINKKKDKQVKV